MAAKANVAVKARAAKAAVSNAAIVAEYAKLVAQSEKLDKRMEEIRAFVREAIPNGEAFDTEDGKFSLVPVKTRTWSVAALKSAFGAKWAAYVKSDNKKVLASMDLMDDKLATALLNSADVTESEQLRFNRK